MLERLEPYHKAEVEALGWRWKDLRRAEQVHGTKVSFIRNKIGDKPQRITFSIVTVPSV